ncbi:hypothetical protein [Shewanella fodinae]|uniref:hypothetical protein n=1 Tax=Shewanella fodinae TaxID=552357 RepID=UPI001674929D|nr:hypothetical protein [Shewanella fodinae]MCL2905187.1 hypothetical protein [Shewanella fodinae]GGY87918.1 hypothetical protein GCM10007169_01370 [Shewanella fodinae]
MFRVFGITKSMAEARARRIVKRLVKDGKNKRKLSDIEYQKALDAEVKRLMTCGKPKMLSHDLSTPSICYDFAALVKDLGQWTIMYRAETGEFLKSGKPKMEWKEYQQ